MQTTSFYHRLATAFAVIMMLGLGLTISARASVFPPLNDPANRTPKPGKFVWAELFTSDSPSAAKFYTGVFGWTAVNIDQHGVNYTVFSNGSHPVAGLRQRDASSKGHPSRWISYISVTDIASSLSNVTKAGGEVKAPARDFPQIGSQAIITDNEGSLVGLLQSTSGDSDDTEPVAGDWNWFHLFAKSPKTAADFYQQVFSYDVNPDSRPGKSNQWLLVSGPLNRGGISSLPGREDAKPGWLGVVRVANLDETVARVPALGGEVIVAPHGTSYGSRFALISDPTGGAVGVVQFQDNADPVNHP